MLPCTVVQGLPLETPRLRFGGLLLPVFNPVCSSSEGIAIGGFRASETIETLLTSSKFRNDQLRLSVVRGDDEARS